MSRFGPFWTMMSRSLLWYDILAKFYRTYGGFRLAGEMRIQMYTHFSCAERGKRNAQKPEVSVQASRLSETDRRCVLRRTQALAPRPTVCRQAWIRQQVAAAQQGVPAEASAVREVYGTGTVHSSNCGRPYHSSPW